MEQSENGAELEPETGTRTGTEGGNRDRSRNGAEDEVEAKGKIREKQETKGHPLTSRLCKVSAS